MKRSWIMVAPIALALSACGGKKCSEIKPGDKFADLDETDYAAGLCGTLASSAGSTVGGQCVTNGEWKCADAGETDKSTCAGTYHCLVQSDASGKVSCVKEYCQD